jgi:putative lipoprotein (rSAM/lipoprotein system)
MKLNFKLINWLCATIISLLGFSACKAEKEILYEYGSPYADYKYMGTITDEEGNPIQGIKATLIGSSNLVSGNEIAVFTTDKDGKFESEYYNERNTNIYKIDFTDTDGELNGGEFASTSIKTSEMESTQTKKNDTHDKWYRGQFERKAEVKLYPQERDKEQVE